MLDGMGANIVDRNMFGSIRGGWGDSDWRSWRGEEPPFHCPVFVLSHYARDPIPLGGGTTFYFVTDGSESDHAHARDIAGNRPVSNAGGASCARQAIKGGSSMRSTCKWLR